MLGKIIREVFRHAFSERGHQYALATIDAQVDLRHQIIHLRSGGTHLDTRINQPRRPHHLLHHLRLMFAFVNRRRG